MLGATHPGAEGGEVEGVFGRTPLRFDPINHRLPPMNGCAITL